MDILKLIVFNHIIPSISVSIISLCLVLFILRLFFIKRPSIRSALLFIPLVKPLFMLISGVQVIGADRIDWVKLKQEGVVRITLPDPYSFFPSSYDHPLKLTDGGVMRTTSTRLLVAMLVIILLAATLLLVRRWLLLLRYRQQLSHEGEIDRTRYTTIFDMLEHLCLKMKVKVPRLAFADIPSPAMVGIRNTTIILPKEIIDELTDDERETILAHELAHIKGKDNVWLWFTCVCRDLMFFNPVAWLTFRLLADERERAADYLAAKTTNKPIDLVKSLVKIGENLLKVPQTEPAWSVKNAMLRPKSSFERRADDLLNFKPYRRLILRTIPVSLLFFLLFYTRFTFTMKIFNGIMLFW